MLTEADQDMRAVLEHNVGFQDSARWIDYARRHGFQPVKADTVRLCPDCSGPPARRKWGQYIYYSTLIHLLECEDCGLVWADAHIDADTIRRHFEGAYKDDEYFRVLRRPIVDHLVGVIDALARRGARVLDVGGARGDLMAQLAATRPDVSVVVNDISETATTWAAEKLGLATLTGDADELAAHEGRYDVVVLSDVLYYEPKIRVLWNALSHLVTQDGSIVIRGPNKHLLIAGWQAWFRLTHTPAQQAMQDRARFFNPEHVFLFRRRYLRTRLASLGFARVHAYPSPPLGSRTGNGVRTLYFRFATSANRLSRHRLVLTPSMIVVGRRLADPPR